jgi:exodeoxyribonuclease VII small subunit
MTDSKNSSKTFTQLFSELEAITKEFEGEHMDIDQSVKKFERGLELAHALKTRLQAIETKVKKIQERFKDI